MKIVDLELEKLCIDLFTQIKLRTSDKGHRDFAFVEYCGLIQIRRCSITIVVFRILNAILRKCTRMVLSSNKYFIEKYMNN